MQKRILSLAFIAAVLFTFFNWSCTKLDTTDIGSDLLPAVDNVHTFDTVLDVVSTQGVFNDSVFVTRTEDHAIGRITNDPLFGTTLANAYVQLKPPFYPYYFGNVGDTINGFGAGLDSVVLCLKYKGFWGDSALPVHIDVREINDPNFRDSVYLDNPTIYQPNVMGSIIGSADVDVRTLENYIKFTNGRDSVNEQVRIKLDPTWAAQLFARDSLATNYVNNAFYSDSFYRRLYNGLALMTDNSTGNGLLYVNFADTSTKIEIHYRRKNNGKLDSVYTSFRLYSNVFGTIGPSNTANYVNRNRAGFPVLSPNSTEHYIQTSPGTYVNLSIPGLAGLSNRIVHRAEVIVEQIPTDPMLDEKLSAPNFLYLDLRDTTIASNWKPIYFDLNSSTIYDPDYKSGYPYFPGSIDFNYFGGYRRTKTGPFGTDIKYYNFNITRYVQQIVTKRTPAYGMRLYAPNAIHYGQISSAYIPFSDNIAFGRVRIGSGSNPNYKLRLRIVYSKL